MASFMFLTFIDNMKPGYEVDLGLTVWDSRLTTGVTVADGG